MVLFIFPAILSMDLHRREKRRLDILCCFYRYRLCRHHRGWGWPRVPPTVVTWAALPSPSPSLFPAALAPHGSSRSNPRSSRTPTTTTPPTRPPTGTLAWPPAPRSPPPCRPSPSATPRATTSSPSCRPPPRCAPRPPCSCRPPTRWARRSSPPPAPRGTSWPSWTRPRVGVSACPCPSAAGASPTSPARSTPRSCCAPRPR